MFLPAVANAVAVAHAVGHFVVGVFAAIWGT